MAHYLVTLLNTLVVVALATAGIVRAEVLCIGQGGHIAVEALGECEAFGHATGSGSSIVNPSCIDTPLAGLLASRTESSSPEVLPPQTLIDAVAFTTPVARSRVFRTGLDIARPAPSVLLTRTVVLLL